MRSIHSRVFQQAKSCHSSTRGMFDKTARFDWLWYAGSMGPADFLLPIGKLDDIPVPEGRDMTMCSYGVHPSITGAVGICDGRLLIRREVRRPEEASPR